MLPWRLPQKMLPCVFPAAATAGRPLTRRELIRLKKRIGCDGYSGTASTPSGDPTEQSCKVGPPNIGYPY